MKNWTILLALTCAFPLSAKTGFNCPKVETLQCRVYEKDPKAFLCTAESVKVLEGTKERGDLPFYGPPVDIIPDFDFTKAQWELVLGEYSYGFPDCVYQDKVSKIKMNFIYRPEDLRLIASQEKCQFAEEKNALHITCE